MQIQYGRNKCLGTYKGFQKGPNISINHCLENSNCTFYATFTFEPYLVNRNFSRASIDPRFRRNISIGIPLDLFIPEEERGHEVYRSAG